MRKINSIFMTALMIISIVSLSLAHGTTTILFKAVDEYGNPLENAYITLVSPPPGAYVIESGYTDENGVIIFQLDNPPENIIVFVSWKEVIVHQSKVSAYSGSVVLKCSVGDLRIKVLTKSLDTVKDSRVIISWNTPLGVKDLSRITDKDGIAEFKRMPLIEYNLSVVFRNKIVYNGKIPANLTDIYTVLLDLYSLKIRVLDYERNPLSGAHVYIEGKGYEEEYKTGSNGFIVAKYLLPGNYTIRVSYKGSEREISINLKETTSIDIVMPKIKTYILKIHVSDNKGKPIAYIPVTIFNPDKTFSETGYTDGKGDLIISLIPGLYYVKVEYKKTVQIREINLDNDSVMEFQFTISSPTQPSGGMTGKELFPPYFIPVVIAISLAASLAVIFHYIVTKLEH